MDVSGGEGVWSVEAKPPFFPLKGPELGQDWATLIFPSPGVGGGGLSAESLTSFSQTIILPEPRLCSSIPDSDPSLQTPIASDHYSTGHQECSKSLVNS